MGVPGLVWRPPPGWPEPPPGWVPPPGWRAPPDWPPAPPDWEYWVPAGAPAAPRQPAPRPPAPRRPAPRQPPARVAEPARQGPGPGTRFVPPAVLTPRTPAR